MAQHPWEVADEPGANVRVAKARGTPGDVWGALSPSPSSKALGSPHPISSTSQIYYHGEPISVNVHVTNNTNKTVKKIKISGTQAEGQSRGWARGLLRGVGGSQRCSLCSQPCK